MNPALLLLLLDDDELLAGTSTGVAEVMPFTLALQTRLSSELSLQVELPLTFTI